MIITIIRIVKYYVVICDTSVCTRKIRPRFTANLSFFTKRHCGVIGEPVTAFTCAQHSGRADHLRQSGRIVRQLDDRKLFVQLKLIRFAADRHPTAREVRGTSVQLQTRFSRLQPVRLHNGPHGYLDVFRQAVHLRKSVRRRVVCHQLPVDFRANDT